MTTGIRRGSRLVSEPVRQKRGSCGFMRWVLITKLLNIRFALSHFGLVVDRQGARFRIPTIVVFGKLSQRLSAVERASLIRLANA